MGERGFLCTSSLEMSSFENVSPGMSPRFLSQKMAQKDPEKKMPSTHANATRRCAKLASEPIHRSAHSAFCRTAGKWSTAAKSARRSAGSST